ncbi:hypothetical protein KY284_030109 [Solanum tuberosum]|nr:hypothetical protein KY284_030109 [Solanum tuberosum]
MERLERDIPQILCKLERIFPPGFFDSMEHLPVHIPYEARIAGLVQYRWMYPFERHNQYKLVEINQRRRYKKYELFILAMQATQVCYVSYPNKKKDKDDWVAVLKVKPRNVIELLDEGVETTSELNVPFQVDEVEVHEIDMTVSIDENILLNDPNGDTLEIDEPIMMVYCKSIIKSK